MGEATVTLIDTSSWTEALRKSGRSDVMERVRNLLVNGEAAWCDMVALELWNGAYGDYEKEQLAKLESEILCLSTTDDVWSLAKTLAKQCRGKGQTVPVADLVIGACAFMHDAELEHSDAHFETILEAYQEHMNS